MKLFTPEISWHQKEPILSVDFCPTTYKLASCGADFTIKIWLIKEDQNGSIRFDFLANLDRHDKSVNVVRFSPNGKLLASAGDDGAVLLWRHNEGEKASTTFGDDSIENKESWVVHKMLRGHIEDIYDLAWAPDSSAFVTGSVDNSAMVWDAVKGQSTKILSDAKHYVQGVCWDPQGNFIAAHSSDRSCRIYSTKTFNRVSNITNVHYDQQGLKTKAQRMFMDETMGSFFRRCSYSPDGSYLFLPAGLYSDEGKTRKTTYVFARGKYDRPLMHLAGPRKATIAVKCCPVVFELMGDKENITPTEDKQKEIPYRMVFAVASLDSVTLYDTQHQHTIGYCAKMHYASITDLAWSSDGKMLVISSTDGYCSIVKFDQGELGTPIEYSAVEFQAKQSQLKKAVKQQKIKEQKEQKAAEKAAEKEQKAAEKAAEKEQKAAEKAAEKALKKATVETVTPDPSPAQKTKVKPIDRNQPTIEKLFVTPVRKRKRTTPNTSPKASNTANETTEESERNAPPLEPVAKPIVQKEPKRVKLITLTTFKKDASQSDQTLAKPIDPSSNPSLTSEKSTNSPLTSTKPTDSPPTSTIIDLTASTTTTVAAKTIPKTPTTPTSSKIKATTLKTATPTSSKTATPTSSKTTAPTTSTGLVAPKMPAKPPKRVNVTTLKTFSNRTPTTSPLQSPKPPKRAMVTTIKTFPDNNAPTTSPAKKFGQEKDNTNSTKDVICID